MRQKLEMMMGRIGVYITNHPLKVIVTVLLLLAFPISYAPQIKIDAPIEGFLHDDDPALLEYNTFREQFGRDERIIIGLKSDSIFTLDFLKMLRNLHEELESNLPYLDDITSLYNVRNTKGEGDKLITDDLLETFPQTQAQVDVIKQQALASHFYKDLFISRDGKMTAIVLETDAFSYEGETSGLDANAFEEGSEEAVPQENKRAFLSDKENAEFIEAVRVITNKYKKEGLEIYIAGSPLVNNALKSQIQTDMYQWIGVVFLVSAVFLFVMFRRLCAVVYPMIVIMLSLLATVGTMAWAGVAFTLPTQIVPSLLMVVGIAATVHVLSIFFDLLNATGNKKEALRDTLTHSGLTIVMTSVTTAIGVGVFAGSEVAPICELGSYAFLGVMVSLFLTLTLLPALLSITRLKPKKTLQEGMFDGMMQKLSVVPVRHYKGIIIISTVLMVLSLVAAVKIGFSHNPLAWSPASTLERTATETIDETLKGSVTIELVVDTKKENGWNDPMRLEKLNLFSTDLENYVDDDMHVGKVISLATIVKETNRALHANQEKYYTIPQDADLVSQMLLLFENSGSDDLQDVVDSQFSKARISIKLPWTDTVKVARLLHYVKEQAAKTFPEDTITATGMVPLLIMTFTHAVDSFVSSYFKAFFGITLMMMFVLGTLRLGLIGTVPILAPILIGLLVMYAANIPLDLLTLLIGLLAIGVAIDNTVHFMYNFKRAYQESKDGAQAIEQAFPSAGKAMVITAIVLSFGFYTAMMSDMVSVQNFGLLTGSVILLALLADLLLAPALMMLIAKRGWIR